MTKLTVPGLIILLSNLAVALVVLFKLDLSPDQIKNGLIVISTVVTLVAGIYGSVHVHSTAKVAAARSYSQQAIFQPDQGDAKSAPAVTEK